MLEKRQLAGRRQQQWRVCCPSSATITFGTGKQRRPQYFSLSGNHISHFSNSLFLHQITLHLQRTGCPGLTSLCEIFLIKLLGCSSSSSSGSEETIVLTRFANFPPVHDHISTKVCDHISTKVRIIFPQKSGSYFPSRNIGHYSASC